MSSLPGRPLVISHRGAKNEAPENTPSAFDKALSFPIDGIELDVQITKDNIPVIYHDRTLWKISREKKRVFNCTYDQLKNLDFGKWFSLKYQGEHVPTLQEVIDRYSAKTRLFVEIKSRAWDRGTGSSVILTQKVINLLKEAQSHHNIDDIFILTFDRTVLVLALQLEPSLNYILNLASSSCLTDYDLNRFSNIYGFCTNINRLTKTFAQTVRQNDQRILTYTCNTPKQVNRALNLGVDVLMTDDPRWLFRYLEQR